MSANAGFAQTDWSMIGRAAGGKDAAARAALEATARRYWPAVYAYVRSSGRDVHEAADLTQGFMCDVMLENRLLESADRNRGRFRNLLLRALENYIALRERKRRSPSRAAAGQPAVTINPQALEAMSTNAGDSPKQAFDRQWGTVLVRQVLEDVQQACEQSGMATHWAVFDARVLTPIKTGRNPVPYAELIERLEVADAAHAANMMITVKRRVAKALFLAVAGTVGRSSDVDRELAALLSSVEHSS